jgi:hypothetical protein
MKLYNVIKQLIFEASSDEITNAIKNRNLVTIYYNGKDSIIIYSNNHIKMYIQFLTIIYLNFIAL